MVPPAAPDASPPEPGPGPIARRSRRRRLVLRLLPVLALLGALVAAGLAWLGSESMLRTVAERAAAATGGRLSIEAPEGSLFGTVRARRVVWSDGGTVAAVDDVSIALDWRALATATLRVSDASAARVEVVTVPSDAPAAPPASLALPMRVELVRARVGELAIRQAGGAAPLRLEDVRASARYRPGLWTLDALSLRAPFGALQAGGTIGDVPPFALRARALLETRVLDEAVAVDAVADGDLSAMAVDARTVLRDASASAKLRLAPFGPSPLASVDLALAALDLSRFAPALPATRLAGRLQAQAPPAAPGAGAGGPPALAGTVSLRNARPGTLDAGLLPVDRLESRFAFDGSRLRLDGLELAGPPGRLAGGASLRLPEREGAPPPFELRLGTDALDLRRVHAALRTTALRGSVAVSPAGTGLAFDARLADGGLALEARARLEGERVDVERARLQARDGVAEFAGRAGIASPYAFEFAGTVSRLDPSRFAEVPPGLLNGSWRAGGVAAPDLAVDASVKLADSRWRGLPASGRAALGWASAGRGRADRLHAVDVAVALGATTLRARGDLGEPGDRLALDLDAPRLRELDARLAGRAALDAELRGALRAPALDATLVARELRVADRLSVRTLKAGAEVASPRALVEVLARVGLVPESAIAAAPAASAARGRGSSRAVDPRSVVPGRTPGDPRGGARAAIAAGPEPSPSAAPASAGARVSLVVQADGLRVGTLAIDSARADLAGDADRHVLSARAAAPARGLDAALRVEGTLERGTGARWSGRLVEATNAAAPRLRLLEPAALALAPGAASVAPLRVEIDGVDGARLALDEASWRDGRMRVLGAIAGVPLRWLGPAASARGLRLEETDALRLGARVDLAGAPGQGGDLRGRIDLYRESGDVTVDVPAAGGGTEPLRAGLQALEARIELADGRASASATMRGTAIGTLRADARMPLAWTPEGAPDIRVPIEGSAEASLPSLAFTRAIAGEAWRFDGALQARVQLAGTLDAPRVTGRIEGTRLVAEQRELGMRLTDGTLSATLSGASVEIERMRFASGGGSVAMTGTLRADERSEAVLTLERMPVPLGAGQRLVLSGETRASLSGGLLTLRGALRADEGVIELTAYNAPNLSRDVVVVRDAAEAAAHAARRAEQRRAQAGGAASAAEADPDADRGFRIRSNVEIDLGDRLRVFGAGFEARLEGRLVLRGRLPDAPRLTGTVRIAQGTWTGFGQKLEIERGTLVFTGPVDNPAIDVVAYRRYLPVEAGVSLTGTARVPKLALVSRPDVPEPEKLSWLVLGTGTDTSRSGAQTVALQAAAATLLASGDPNAKMPSLASTFGLDVVSIRTGQVGNTGESGSASTSAQDSIVTLGKRITERLFVSYEQSLRGLQNLLRLQYEITERLSVRGSAGTRTAVDLLWQFRYD